MASEAILLAAAFGITLSLFGKKAKAMQRHGVFAEADDLYDALQDDVRKIEEVVIQVQIAANNTDDFEEFLWRLIRAHLELLHFVSPDHRKGLLTEIAGYLQDLEDFGDLPAEIQLWRGIINCRLAEVEQDLDEKIDLLLRASRYLDWAEGMEEVMPMPEPPYAKALIAHWKGYCHFIIAYLRAKAPPDQDLPKGFSFEDGLEYFLKAENSTPGFYMRNPLLITKTYKILRNYEKFKLWRQRTLALPVIRKEDENLHRAALHEKY